MPKREVWTLRIIKYDPTDPTQEILLNFDVDVGNPRGLAASVRGLAEMLKRLGTPERLGQFVRQNRALINAMRDSKVKLKTRPPEVKWPEELLRP